MLERGLVVLAVAVSLASASRVQAHGRPAAMFHFAWSPGAPDRLVAQGTWGLAISGDAGGTWRWVCAASFGVDPRTEDPPVAVTADGAILVATYNGVTRSDDGGCTWADPTLPGEDILDLHTHGTTVYAVAAGVLEPDRLYRSEDGAQTWTEIGDGFGDILVDRVVTAPSDPARLYLGGAVVNADPRRPTVVVSRDSGATFASIEVTPEDGERRVNVWAVDPDDPDIVYAQVLHFNGEAVPERVIRSSDGGQSWETVLRIPHIGGILAVEGGVVYAASRLGGLYRALDGRTFQPIDDALAVTCLAQAAGQVWACVDQARSGHALASVADSRSPPVPRIMLGEIREMLECPLCTPVGTVCPAWATDVALDLGIAGVLPSNFDAGALTGAPRDAGVHGECVPGAGGCGRCVAAPTAGGAYEIAWLLAPLAWLWTRRRKRDRDDMVKRDRYPVSNVKV